MQATRVVRTDKPSNQDLFQAPFFRRFTLRPGDKPLDLGDGIAKNYPFPTLYHDVGCAIGIFLCDRDAARALMPHPKLEPVPMPRGRTLVIFSCYQYRQVLEVWPYNEIAMTIPVLANARFRPPVLPMLASGLFPRFGYYVFGMPVTSRENQLRGNLIWGLPKVTQGIDIERVGREVVTTAREDDGTPYFELRVPTTGTPTDFDVTSSVFSRLDGRILRAPTYFKGRFWVEKHMGTLLRKNLAPAHPVLTIGSGPSAKPLRELGIEPQPFQTRYTPSMNAAFDLPTKGWEIEPMIERPNVLVFGTGAVGATVGGWLAEGYDKVWLLDVPKVAETLRTRGLTLYLGGDKARARTVKVQAVSSLSEAPPADIVIIAVKTYSLDHVGGLVKAALGDAPLIVALQNGVDNQQILPRHFSKVVYGVVAYNAWLDEPGVVGYQKKGPLVLGTPRGDLGAEARWAAGVLGRGVETVVTDHFQDAAHSKMVINLTNSLQALIGHPQRPIDDRPLFQRLLTNLTWEGVQVVKAAGHHECRLGGMPPWWLMRAAATLPQALTRRAFEKNVKKMVMSSMAQDVQRGGTDSELETLNGYFIRLADQHGLAVPYNRAIYALCKERFGKPGFRPLGLDDVWAAVQLAIARAAAAA